LKTLHKAAFLGTVLALTISGAATAAEPTHGKKTKEITEIVGYNVTETQTFEGPKARLFKRMDKNSDSALSFKEYQNYATVDNEYEIFSLMDTNNNKSVTIEEFINARPTKGSTQFSSEMFGKVSGTNLKTRKLPEVKSYYEPIEPKIVEIKPIEPDASK